MLQPGALSAMGFRFDNWDANPSGSLGTAITPGVSNAEGAWTQVASGASVASDVYLVSVHVHGGGQSGVDKSYLFDLGVDPAGGTAYTEVISNVPCGHGATMGTPAAGVGHRFIFPLFIKSGSSVAVRVQGLNSTASGTLRVVVSLRGAPARPEMFPAGAYSETLGAVTASTSGTAFTPGNAADGTWVSLGTTTRPLWFWQLGYQLANTVTAAEFCYIELAHGDATNKHIMLRLMHANLSTETIGMAETENLDFAACYWPLPAGTELWVRGRTAAAPNTGYQAAAVGIGG